ncbi:IS110 family transposase [Roseibium sp. Sym1]|uniref:IS110 family transposase n=1 Tax=Roseibium sp. Sym1 TaxID=3016006 RepID=UPI0022B3997D|nr:IS110 family transposase [Roseibium sp. Sym1]
MSVLECAPSHVVGIDVSKDTLVVFDQTQQRLTSIDNNRDAIAKLVASFGPDALVVCEPTGGHEALLVSELIAQGVACHRADTLKVQAFIKSFGRLAKTDAIDAKALAQYGEERWKQLPLLQPKDEAQGELAALVSRREGLMAIKIAETNRLKAPANNRRLVRSFKTVIACVQRQIDRIDEEIEDLIASSQTLSRRMQICCSLPGVGERTAIALLATMPELGTLTRRQAASLAGLAPHPRDSGTLKGYRKMRGGRPEVRKGVFMAALAGSRAKGPLSAFYQRLIENGKKPIVAISALMRKIIVILNAKIRDEMSAMS